MELALPVPTSPSGKVYKYSPSPDAQPRLFLIGNAPDERNISEDERGRMRREPGPGQTVCPYSGYIGDDDDFVHADDIEAIKKHALWLAENDLSDIVGEWAKEFNRRQPRGGFISMKMEHKPRRRPKPLAIREDLLRSLECEICERQYGVYALALFCPDCGAPNVALHFRREVALIGEQIALADELDQQGKNEIAYRLMGNAHEDVLTAFEATLKSVHAQLVRTHLPDQVEKILGKKAVGNAFQNVERGRKLFAKLGIDPFDGLDEAGIKHIQLNAEKRHVLGHNLGIADDHYVSFAEDLEPGETVTLIGDDIRRFADLCLSVVARLEDSLLPAPPTDE
ncbi:hypothetical protein [Roseivivax marinus]|uniref:hypothetical protein n=1 Tax=Roseivivax marinus TaxID=1379903 RepID=UPI00138DDC1B|nr:hypothetical protein [Roseivivax marinus]